MGAQLYQTYIWSGVSSGNANATWRPPTISARSLAAEVVPFNPTLASVGSGVLEAAISNLLPELPYGLWQVIS